MHKPIHFSNTKARDDFLLCVALVGLGGAGCMPEALGLLATRPPPPPLSGEDGVLFIGLPAGLLTALEMDIGSKERGYSI